MEEAQEKEKEPWAEASKCRLLSCPECVAGGPASQGTSQPGKLYYIVTQLQRRRRTLLVAEWRVGMGPGRSLEAGIVAP